MPAAEQPDINVDATPAALTGHGIVAGFGIPGRAVVDALTRRRQPVIVIELNPRTVERLVHTFHPGTQFIFGDVSEEAMLLQAGIKTAALLAITVPVDSAVLEAVKVGRRLNPGIHIIARCRYISTALEASRCGATEVVSEEQVVAQEFTRLIERG